MMVIWEPNSPSSKCGRSYEGLSTPTILSNIQSLSGPLYSLCLQETLPQICPLLKRSTNKSQTPRSESHSLKEDPAYPAFDWGLRLPTPSLSGLPAVIHSFLRTTTMSELQGLESTTVQVFKTSEKGVPAFWRRLEKCSSPRRGGRRLHGPQNQFSSHKTSDSKFPLYVSQIKPPRGKVFGLGHNIPPCSFSRIYYHSTHSLYYNPSIPDNVSCQKIYTLT